VKDIAATSLGSIIVCEHSNTPNANQFLFGFGRNEDRESYPDIRSLPTDITQPIPFAAAASEISFVFCGFSSCFGVDRNNPKLYYSWYS
jgi:hypothetical protein